MSKNNQIFFRWLFIFALLATAFFASWFMVIESAGFYNRFYEAGEQWDLGLWAAVLNEVFLLIMAAVWLPAIQTKHRQMVHPANILVKLLVVFLFFNTVGGASFNVIQHKLVEIQQQANRIQVLEVLERQIQAQKESFEVFAEQNQRLNTAISVRELQRVTEELKDLQSKQQSTVALWLDIALLALLRFSIQLANITAVWLAGWLYRQPFVVKPKPKVINQKKTPSKPAVPNLEMVDATNTQPQPPIIKQKVINIPKVVNAPNLVKTQPVAKVRAKVKAKEPTNKIVQPAVPATSNVLLFTTEETTAEETSKEESINFNVPEVDVAAESLEKLRVRIQSLVKKLPAGISVEEFCRVAGVEVIEFKLLISNQTLQPAEHLGSANETYQKIEALYQQQTGLGYNE